MAGEIVSTSSPVTLVGGGQATERDLKLAMTLGSEVVVADGGAGLALRCGVIPVAVIGDFDTISDADRAAIPAHRLFPISEQDSTDFDKALRNIAAPVVVAVGFLGARVDHQLAAFNTLVRLSDRACILLGQRELVFHLPPQVELETRKGDVVSLFPMSCVTGRSDGLEWPIEGLRFSPDQRVGTSNHATGPVRLEMDGPGMLAMVPRRLLVPTAQMMSRLPALSRWPAPAQQ